MSRIKEALVSAFTGNLDDMRETFASELNVKAYDALDVCKQHVAQEMFKEMNEEVEQIDELSKKTLGSYINKASFQASKLSASLRGKDGIKNYNKILKRRDGIGKAVEKLTKE